VPKVRQLFPVALSIRSATDALELDRDGRIIREAIISGALPAYSTPGSKRPRVLVEDLTEWVRATWPLALIKPRKRSVPK
jgi:hypothetical protein